MERYGFIDDYSEGAHPQVLESIVRTNGLQQTAYGNDTSSEIARTAIRRKLKCSQDVGVWFVPTGTSANIVSIASCLRPHEAVIAVSSGHIVLRETGAVESTGHKIITVQPVNGKLTSAAIEQALEANSQYPHMAKPRMLYISNATEVGTVYTRTELVALKSLCEKRGLLLFLDGARLGSAMASAKNDISWPDLLELTDLFWIGGTKNGALLGEAIVIKDASLAANFGFHVKQRGCLLAKSWVMGAQFLALFEDESDLFSKLASHANDMAATISQAITEAGYDLAADTETNQVFAILPMALTERLQRDFSFHIWDRLGRQGSEEVENATIRLVTSWATQREQVSKLCQILKSWRFESMAAIQQA